jgi:Methyltransferase domain
VNLDQVWKELAPERIEALAKAFPWPRERPAVEHPRAHLGWLEEGGRQLLAEALPADARLVVELGAWLGLTTRFLAEQAPGAVVVAIDHWQGSSEHQSRPEWRSMLPALYETFLALCWPYRERIIPLRMTTLMGLQTLADYGLRPDLIYVDAEHTYEAVFSELTLAKRLFPRASLLGDDYPHPPVRGAVDEFAALHGLAVATRGNAWRLLNQPGEAGRPAPRPAGGRACPRERPPEGAG